MTTVASGEWVRDRYPASSVPLECLVALEHQPDYCERADLRVGPHANVGWLLSDGHVAQGRGAAIASIDAADGRTRTFAELSRASTSLAAGLLRLGVRRGDRVAFRAPNRSDVLIAAAAAWKAGAVVVPTPTQARATELRYLLDDTGARVLLAAPEVEGPATVEAAVTGSTVEHVIAVGPGDTPAAARPWEELMDPGDAEAELPETSADDLAILWHTGGTTGRPKGCYHTHRRYLHGGHALAEAIGLQPADRWSAAAPVGHALGFLCHTSFSVLNGATAVFIEDFRAPAAVVDAIAAHRVDTFASIAATWARMLDVVEADETLDVSSLRRAYAMWQSASTADLAARWAARGVRLRNNFGSTAFATWIITQGEHDRCAPASLGRPLAGYTLAVIEPDDAARTPEVPAGPALGQLAVKGPTGLTYWRRPELQEREVRDGWTVVDDLVEIDADAFVAYRGRTDFIISTAGYKVAPLEVEEVLAAHPAVREVGVVGAPDRERGEVVAAFVAVHDSAVAGPALVRELQDHVKAAIAPYKYPRRIEFVAQLPRDHVGKVQPKVLRTWAEGGSRDVVA